MSNVAYIALAAFFCGFGFFVSGLSSALGVGASLFCVPVLALLLPNLGVPGGACISVAVATSLTASCVIAFAGARAHFVAGNLNRETVVAAAPALAAAAAGGVAGGMFLSTVTGVVVVGTVVASQLLVAAILLLRGRGPALGTPAAHQAHSRVVVAQRGSCLYVAGVGGLTSIGAGGVFLVPFFLWRGVPKTQAAGLASLLGIAIAPSATLVYLSRPSTLHAVDMLGLVHWPIACSIALGAVFGAAGGARAARAVSTHRWTWALAAALVASSARAASKFF